MLPKKGKSLPPKSDGEGHPRRYAEIISLALKAELDDSRRTIKTVQRWTNASERTVKNWLSGTCGPDGDHLVALLVHSDTVLQMLLIASRRLDLVEILMTSSSGRFVGSERTPSRIGVQDPPRFLHDPDHVPDADPEIDPDRAFAPNERQIWFLGELAKGRHVSAMTLRNRFDVAEKTAKRDIVALKSNGLVRFVGTRRRGHYRLVSLGPR